MEENEELMYSGTNQEEVSVAPRIQKHAIICFVIALLFCIGMWFQPQEIGFWGGILFIVFATLFTTIGVFIGDALRRFAMPDAFFSTGFVDTIKQKLFWGFGPQVIGWIVGIVVTNGFLANVLGLTQFA